jgi:uncharacterized membrane protein
VRSLCDDQRIGCTRARLRRARRPGSFGTRPFSARETEALRVVTERPGITLAELREAFGVGKTRNWQIVSRLEVGHIRREAADDSD